MRQSLLVWIFLVYLGVSAADAQTAHDDADNPAPYGVPVGDDVAFTHVLLDQLEGRLGGDDSFRWEGEAWSGTDENRLRLRSEGEVSNGTIEDGQQELLYSRPVSTYFDFTGGARYDLDSGSGRGWVAFGVEGLAPLFFHVAATGYIGSDGHYAAKLEASYDEPLTQRLILQPEIEMNLYSKADPARDVGSDINDIDAGLRLRYEISRKFAPYMGVAYQSKYRTAPNFTQMIGEQPSELRFTVGVRAWL